MYYHKKKSCLLCDTNSTYPKATKCDSFIGHQSQQNKETTYREFKMVQYESNLLPISPSVFKLGLGLYRQA